MGAEPTFPPLLTGHKLALGTVPAEWARAKVEKGQLGAGDLGWSEETDVLRLALVLEPDVEQARCQEILFAAMVAIGDSLGALCPPEVAITYQWPSMILANAAQVGSVDLVVSEEEPDGIPDWMVFSLDLRLRPAPGESDPGKDPSRTTLWDEGCGLLGRTGMIESISRHLINLIHHWSEDGFKPVHEQWWARISAQERFAAHALEDAGSVMLLGLDETGNALVKTGNTTRTVSTFDALTRLRAGEGAGR